MLPPCALSVKVCASTLDGSSGSEKVALAVVVAATPLLPFAGSTRVTVSGAVVNVVVVRASGAPAQLWIPEESVKL